jgi:hypothetical protein
MKLIALCALLGACSAKLELAFGSRRKSTAISLDEVKAIEVTRVLMKSPALVATVRFGELTKQEAALLTAPLCARMDPDALCDCYRKFGKDDRLIDYLSPACVRGIPIALFKFLDPKFVTVLGESFIKAMSAKQVGGLPEKSRQALSEKQLIALVKSDMDGLAEMGSNCAAISEAHVELIEKQPNVIKALTPDCVKHFTKALSGIGPNLAKEFRLFSKLPLRSVQHIPKRFRTPEIITSVLSNGANCANMGNADLAIVPAEKWRLLGKECWKHASQSKNTFTISGKKLALLPEFAWSAVAHQFPARLTVKGVVDTNLIKGLLTKFGKENSDPCVGTSDLIAVFNHPGVIPSISEECLAKISLGRIASFSAKLISSFPAKIVTSWHRLQIAAIKPKVFPHLSKAFVKALSNGCEGLNHEQLVTTGSESNLLKFLSPKCVSSIPTDLLSSLPAYTITRFADDAFSGLNRLSFASGGRGEEMINQLLAAMRPEQIRELKGTELHVCTGLNLDIAVVMKGAGDHTTVSRRPALGPILLESCLPRVDHQSFATLSTVDLRYIAERHLFKEVITKGAGYVPAEVFKGLKQETLNSLSLSACAGLRASQLADLPPNLSLTKMNCLAAMRPKELAKLMQQRKNVRLPTDIATILTSLHMEHLSVNDLIAEDFEYLGRDVVEVLNPCHSIKETELPKEFWHVNAYCLASLPKLHKIKFETIKEHLSASKLALLSKSQVKAVEKGWGVKLDLKATRSDIDEDKMIIHVGPFSSHKLSKD